MIHRFTTRLLTNFPVFGGIAGSAVSLKPHEQEMRKMENKASLLVGSCAILSRSLRLRPEPGRAANVSMARVPAQFIPSLSARLLTAACAAALFVLPTQLHAEKPEATEAAYPTVRLLTMADARRIVDAAEARATQDGWDVAIVIVDAGGHLTYLRRMDGTQTGSIDIAIRKAVAAVEFKRPTKDLQDLIAEDNLTYVLSLPNVTAVEGGLPIVHGGHVIGAIGISGVTAAQDGIIAAAGITGL